MVIVNVDVDPTHATELFVYVGVTVTVATTGILVALTPVNDVMFPVPDAPRPIDIVLLAHVYTVDATIPVIVKTLTVDTAHTA
jgi:D-ribose pyranose/furanose isomerase RbsD